MKIGNNPLSRNLAELLGHKDKTRGEFIQLLEDLHANIEKRYLGEGKNKATVGSLKAYITGRRMPQFHTMTQIAEVYQVSPYDLYVDKEKFIEKDGVIPIKHMDEIKIEVIDVILKKDIDEIKKTIIQDILTIKSPDLIGLVKFQLDVYKKKDVEPPKKIDAEEKPDPSPEKNKSI